MADVGSRRVLSNKLGGGPHGLGEPDDTTLRRVETEVLIPKLIRDITRIEKCKQHVDLFNNCVKEWPLLMVMKCRKENEEMKKCQEYWYYNEEFKKTCKAIYLKERSEYRRTGITKKQKEALNLNSQANVN